MLQNVQKCNTHQNNHTHAGEEGYDFYDQVFVHAFADPVCIRRKHIVIIAVIVKSPAAEGIQATDAGGFLR